MHVFVSDLHLTDGTIGESVSDDQLTAHLLGELPKLESPIDLVFLGDIFELLRSSEWAPLWDDAKVAPWTNMGVGFQNFPPKAAKTALTILRRITARFPKFRAALKAQTDAGKLRTHYVPGNHDYMVQLSADCRREVCDFLALQHPASDRFFSHYAHASAEIFAVHGNVADPLNWHDESAGRWAYGDVIVLRLVNVFITEACTGAGCDPNETGSLIARAYQDLDNVDSVELALYFRYILERHLTNQNQRDEVLDLWTDVVNGVLSEKAFSDEKLYGDRTHKYMRYALQLSKEQSLAQLVPDLRQKYEALFGQKDPYIEEAQDLLESQDGYRYILMGHTHRPLIAQLESPDSRPAYYVNTGCWRRVVLRGTKANCFRPAAVRSRFVVDGAGRPYTYRLVREIETE